MPDEQVAQKHAVNDDTVANRGRGRPSRYVPDLGTADSAVNRMMACGFKKDEARVDLCRAIADRKVHILVVRAERKELTWPHDTVAPPHALKPADIDWENSRPSAKWRTGPMIGDYWSIEEWKERQIELVEVSTVDVIDLFCPKEVSVERGNASAGVHPSADAAKFAQEQTGHATGRAAATRGQEGETAVTRRADRGRIKSILSRGQASQKVRGDPPRPRGSAERWTVLVPNPPDGHKHGMAADLGRRIDPHRPAYICIEPRRSAYAEYCAYVSNSALLTVLP